MTANQESLEPDAPTTPTRPTLLVLDDEVSVRRLLVRILSRDGYQIHEAATIDEAYDFARTISRIDVFVTDANVDGKDASEEVERFRLLHPHLAVVLISGCEPETERASALDRLGVKFLAKPFNPPQLRDAIDVAMRHGAATSTVVPIVAESFASNPALPQAR